MKKIPLLIALAALGLASCSGGESSSSSVSSATTDTSSSSSSSSSSSISSEESSSSELPPLTELDEETALVILQEASQKSYVSYTYSTRAYLDNFITGDVMTNDLTTFAMRNYVDGAEADYTYDSLTGIMEPVVAASKTGRYASYPLTDKYYAHALEIENSEGPDSDSYYEVLETSPFSNASLISDNLGALFADVYACFADSESVWNPSLGFTIGEITIEKDSDNFVVSIEAVAPAYEYGGAELGHAEVVISPSREIVSLEFGYLIYDLDYDETADPNEHANNIRIYRAENLVVGDSFTGTIDSINLENIPEKNITGVIPEILDIADGEIDETTALDLAKNIMAYAENTIRVTYHNEYQNYYDPIYYEPMGETDEDGVVTLYQDSIVIDEGTIASVDGATSLETIRQINYDEEGIKIRNYVGETNMSLLFDPVSALTITWSDYFIPTPMGLNFMVDSTLQSIVSSGFGVDEEMGRTITYVGGNKNGTNMHVSYQVVDYQTSNLTLMFTDDALTSVTLQTQSDYDNTSYSYTLEAGTPEVFTGELLPFELPTGIYF